MALSVSDVRRLDLNAEELGVPIERLMDHAGQALARQVARHLRKGQLAVFLCGKGNNGGDGFAAAGHLLAKGQRALVVLAEPASRIRSPAARHHLARLPKASVQRWTGRANTPLQEAYVVVDCLLGAGAHGEPRAPYAAMIRWANTRRKARRHLIACDLPSGLGTRTAIHPHETITFHARKQGMTAENSGRILVRDISIPRRAAADIGIGDLDAGYRRPAWDSHKGDNGLVLVVAGCVPLLGAPHYVSLGAYRTGADLVHVATARDAADVLRAWGPQPIVHDANAGAWLTPEGVPAIVALMDRCTAVVVGPGLGTHKATRKATQTILREAARRDLPTVVDADGLDAVEAKLLRRHGSRMVLTPHAREFLDLSGTAATRRNVEGYARQHGVTVLRKSAVDVVSDGQRTRECRRGHPTLTVGGTGDVLAGIVAALLAKGAPPFEAACAASYLLKSAGEVAASLRSYGAGPTDVAEAIPSVLLRLP